MTPAQFRAIGAALCGPSWKLPLARALGLNPRTVTYYATDEDKRHRPIPPATAAQLVSMLYAQADAITILARSIKLPATEKPRAKK